MAVSYFMNSESMVMWSGQVFYSAELRDEMGVEVLVQLNYLVA